MGTRDRKIIATVVALALILFVVLFLITILDAPAWIEFGVLLIMLAIILLGSYWFIILPGDSADRRRPR